MKQILELEKNIQILDDAKKLILESWVSFDEVIEVLSTHQMDKDYFLDVFAGDIFDYYIGVVKKEKEIGDCPVMASFLDYLSEHDVSSAELFLICTHFRKSMLDFIFDSNRISKALFDEVSYVFDLNFSGVLDQYSGRIYSAQRETKVHKRRFEEYNLAIDHSAMVCKMDPKGIITYANSRFSDISGYSQEELVGQAARSLQKEINSIADEMWEQLQKKEVFHGILTNYTKSGEAYYTETTIVPMLDHEDNIQEYLAIRYDVSELILTRDAALNAERTKDQFLANMSHEIRTPLNAILGFVAVLRNRIKDPENSRYLNIISSSGESLLAIIGDILDFAKIKEGKLNIDPHYFNPTEELSNTLELFSSRMFEKNIQYITYIDPHLPVSIKTDGVRIKQIMTNFLSNALKFTPKEGIISVIITAEKNQLIISVKDSGCGISKEAITRIFNAFEQAESSTTRKYGGTGLGLSICQRLSEMMGGDIEVESILDKGSLFRLRVPIQSSSKRNEYTPYKVHLENTNTIHMHLLQRYFHNMGMQFCKEASSQSINFYSYNSSSTIVEPSVLVSSMPVEGVESLTPCFDANKIMQVIEGRGSLQIKKSVDKFQFKGRVLVVEDNAANQTLLGLLLDEYGLNYEIVSNGLEAYNIFKTQEFDLILMDEQMPVMGGREASEKIMQYEIDHLLKHTPIISVTANALKGDKEEFLDAGMDGYIAKPIENVKLEEVLRKFLPHKGDSVSQITELPSYNNISAEEMASKIGLNVKHIPILVQSFIDESAGILEGLEGAIASQDYEAISGFAHSIKGSSGNLKFEELYELAKDMELSAKDKKEDYPYAEACASLKKAIESISL